MCLLVLCHDVLDVSGTGRRREGGTPSTEDGTEVSQGSQAQVRRLGDWHDWVDVVDSVEYSRDSK